jgi:predicted nucleic acid-binding Zn ribbon protein
MSDEPVRLCPRCGKDVRRLIFGGSGVIFKGSGFYVNDSRGKNPAAPAGSKAAGSDGTAAPASKKSDTSSGAPAGTSTAPASSANGGTGRPSASAIKETA